jgi:hypothetical protein
MTFADASITTLPASKEAQAGGDTRGVKPLFPFLGWGSKRGYAYFQGEEAITGRAGLRQQATSPKLAKSIEIQSS